MIARLWLPLQRRAAAAWPVAAALSLAPLALASRWPVGWVTLSMAVFVLAPGALAFRRYRAEGELGAAGATGLLWAMLPFALVGAIGQPSLALFFVVSAMAGSLGGVPLGLRLAECRSQARVGSVASLEPVPKSNATSTVAAAVVFGAVLSAPWMALPAVGASGTQHLTVSAWHLLGWAVAWAMLTQSVTRVLVWCVGLGAFVWLMPWQVSSVSAGLFVGIAAAVYADGLDASGPRLRSYVEWVGIWACGGLLVLSLDAPILPSLLAGAVSLGFAVLSDAVAVRWPPAKAPDPLAAVRKAAWSLPPFFRWFAVAKLGADPLYARFSERVASASHWGDVLDVGAGTGLASALAVRAPSTTSVTLLDLDADKLRSAAALIKGASERVHPRVLLGHFPASSAELWAGQSDTAQFDTAPPDTERPDTLFDTVLLFDMLHYAPPEAQREMIAAASALLRRGGVMLLRDAVARHDGDAGKVGAMERWTTLFGFNPPGRTYFQTESELRAMFASCGLEVTEWEACGDENVWMALRHRV